MTESKLHTPYSNAFYDSAEEGMLSSARSVLPIILDLLEVRSVVDIGCGRGAWLKVLQELGVNQIQGIDGHYVDKGRLLIPSANFREADLCQPFELTESYDLAICLEVGEHLPNTAAGSLVSMLVRAAPAVLFSAALPGQGGTNHINEQMPGYWRSLFSAHGYTMLDVIRPKILMDKNVEWWYRQNIVLFASKQLMEEKAHLAEFRLPDMGLGIEWVHANVMNHGAKVAGRKFMSALLSAARKRLRHRN